MEHSQKKRKLNVIDFIVIGILVAALAFAAYMLLNRGGDKNEAITNADALSAPNLRYTVLCEDLDPVLAQNIIDTLSAKPMEVNGTTVEMTRIFNKNALADAQIVAYEAVEGAEGKSNVLLTIEANAEETLGAYAVKLQEIRVGKSHVVKTVGIEIEGVILSMEKIG